jgi:hypothetical protein
MKTSLLQQFALGGVFIVALAVSSAHAQTRTWVSSAGDDGFPCSRTSPCKTLAGAFAKTAAGGEISVVDSAGYGTLTINKAITINGEGNLASVLTSSGSGIIVAAGASDQVILRNLSINGTGGGTAGINISSGNVTIDKCFIYDFTSGFIGGMGIFVGGSSSTVQVDVRDTDISASSHGVLAQTSGSSVVMGLDNVRINNVGGIGVGTLSSGAFISVRNSSIRNAGTTAISTSGGVINVIGSSLINSGTAVSANGAGSSVRLTDITMLDNNVGLAIAGGATIITGTNNKTNNLGAAPNGGSLTNF